MSATGSKERLRQRWSGFAAGTVAVLLVWALSLTPVGGLIDSKMFDFFTILSAPRVSRAPIVILAIDGPTFQELQLQWPFPRSVHGRLLQRLHADGAAAVGFDVVFAEPSSPAEDLAFAQAIASSGPVVLAASRERLDHGNATIWIDAQPIGPLLAAGGIPGDIGVQPDEDFVVRRNLGGRGSMAAQLAGHARVPLSVPERAADLIEYLGPHGTIDTRSYYQAVLPGLLPQGFFRDKFVLIGRTTQTAAELRSARAHTFNSPFALADPGEQLFPGVEIHATLLANRLSGGGFLTVGPGWGLALVAVLCAMLALANAKGHPAATAGFTAAMAAGVVTLSWLLFTLQKWWLPPVFPVVALAAFSTSRGAVNHLAERRRALRMRSLFSQYVPSAVVARLVEHPELMALGGEARDVTLMFTDLSSFTAMSEQLSAEQTVDLLSAYFETMTAIIHRHQGTVDKFIGDGIMAFWGAPLADAAHAEHAVRAAIEMQAAMAGLVRDLQSRGLPPIAMRIGMHSGRAVIGNVGSSSRFSYTAVGDAVNLAARLEGANKAFGTGILLSDSTAAQLPAELPLRVLDEVVVKGKTEPVRVFTPCCDTALCEHSTAALEAFRARRWDESEARLRDVLALQPADPAALRLLERIGHAHGLPAGAPWSAAVALDKL
jgi:adenylate cyclase